MAKTSNNDKIVKTPKGYKFVVVRLPDGRKVIVPDNKSNIAIIGLSGNINKPTATTKKVIGNINEKINSKYINKYNEVDAGVGL